MNVLALLPASYHSALVFILLLDLLVSTSLLQENLIIAFIMTSIMTAIDMIPVGTSIVAVLCYFEGAFVYFLIDPYRAQIALIKLGNQGLVGSLEFNLINSLTWKASGTESKPSLAVCSTSRRQIHFQVIAITSSPSQILLEPISRSRTSIKVIYGRWATECWSSFLPVSLLKSRAEHAEATGSGQSHQTYRRRSNFVLICPRKSGNRGIRSSAKLPLVASSCPTFPPWLSRRPSTARRSDNCRKRTTWPFWIQLPFA